MEHGAERRANSEKNMPLIFIKAIPFIDDSHSKA